MNCEKARTLIALRVGEDLGESENRAVLRHLAQCPCCRRLTASLEQSCTLLHQHAAVDSGSFRDSLWPRLSRQLATRPRRRAADRFNGWFPAVAVVVACVVMVILSNHRPAAHSSPSEAIAPPTHAADFSPDDIALPVSTRRVSWPVDSMSGERAQPVPLTDWTALPVPAESSSADDPYGGFPSALPPHRTRYRSGTSTGPRR